MLYLSNCRVMNPPSPPTSEQSSELPVVHSPTRTQCHPFTIRLIPQNPLTVMMTRIVSCVGIKATSCDSLNKGNTFLIPGQALLTPVMAVTFLQESGGKSPLCLWGRSKDSTFSDIPSILKRARLSDLGTSIPVNLVILTRLPNVWFIIST